MNVTGSQAQLIRLAEGVRELYLALADRFAETDDLHALWHDLARGEAEQAAGLRRLAPAATVSGAPNDPTLAGVLQRHLASMAERVRRDRLSPASFEIEGGGTTAGSFFESAGVCLIFPR